MINRLYEILGVPYPFDPTALYATSPFLSPYALAAVRLSLAFYTLFTLIFVLVWNSVRLGSGDTFFSYFTELSYIGLCSYFFASGVQTLVYARSRGKSYPLERWPRFLQFLHVLLFTTITTFPIIVTIVFWAVLHSGTPFVNQFQVWSNVSQHALNAVFALFEILFTHAGPPPLSHAIFIVVLLACYLGVAYITYATQGFYTYSFLDPVEEGPKLAAWIVGIAAGGLVVFFLMSMLIVLRERLVRRGRLGTPLRSDFADEEAQGERLDEWEAVEVERPVPMKTREKRVGPV